MNFNFSCSETNCPMLRANCPIISKDFRDVHLEGIRTNTYGVFLVADIRNSTFVVLTINPAVIESR